MRHVTGARDNVLADIGLGMEDVEKAELALRIRKTVDELGLKQQEAARRMGLSQPRYSKLSRGQLGDFSRGKLEACLQRLGHDLVLVVRPRHEGVGKWSVRDAKAA